MLNPFTITHTIHQNSNDSCNHDDFWTRWHKKSGTHSSLDTREIQSAKCAILCSGNKTRHQKPQLLLCCVGPVWLTRAVRSAVRQSNSWREDRPFNTLQLYEYKTHWDKRDPSLGSLCVPAFKIHQGEIIKTKTTWSGQFQNASTQVSDIKQEVWGGDFAKDAWTPPSRLCPDRI